jgi:AhpD family alkylhydroperoxidase
MTDQFQKRIFTPGLLLTDAAFLLAHGPSLIGVTRDENITRTFVEKIMTVTTAVNECTYCAWYHAKAAVASGIGAEEVKCLLDLEFQATASEFEIMALLYAQHYAETNRQPEEHMTARLFDAYGQRTAKHILLVIRMISFGNLVGNTWDAILSRFKGRPAPESNVVFELAFFLFTFWFMVPAMWLIRSDGKQTVTLGRPEPMPDSSQRSAAIRVRDGSHRTR